MANATLGELLKRQMNEAKSTKFKDEEQEALDTSLSDVLVRGTDQLTTVDKGGWLKLYNQAASSLGDKEYSHSRENTLGEIFFFERRVTRAPGQDAKLRCGDAEDAPGGLVENGEKTTDEMVEDPVYQAAAASEGTKKTRALDQRSQLKRPLGKTKSSKGACTFYVSSNTVYVDFHGGDAPEKIVLPETAMKAYMLSSDPDPDGHYEIVNIREGEVAQFLALRRKPQW